MPVSESDKMEVSVLERRLSEKAEHLPIKKRKFVYRDSSPPLNTASSEGTASIAACHHSSSQEVHPKPDASCPPSTSLTVADSPQSGSTDSKLDEKKFVESCKKARENENNSDTSLLDRVACNNGLGGAADLCEGSQVVSNDMQNLQPPGTVEFLANSVKLESMSAKETDFHLSAIPAQDVASSMHFSSLDKATVYNTTLGEFTLDNSCSQAPSESECSKMNQVTINTQKSTALDDRLNWDLNTVMAWEETLESDHNMNSDKVGKSEGYEQERKHGSARNIGNENLPVGLKSLTPKIEKSELDECKPGVKGISRLLSPVINSVPHVAVSNLNCLKNQHANSSTNAVPVSVPSVFKLKYPTCAISAKHVNVMAAGANLSLKHSVPPSFGRGHASEKNVVSSKIVGSGSNFSHAITSVQTAENEKLNLSLVTAPSPENKVHQSGSTFNEDDKSKVKRITTSNGMTIENLIGKGRSEITQNVVSSKSVDSGNYVNHAITTLQTTENEKLKLSLVTVASTEKGVHPNASSFDKDDKAEVKRAITSNGITMEDQPAAVSSMHDVLCSDAGVLLQSGKSPLTGTIDDKSCDSHTKHPNDLLCYNKEGCDYEDLPSDIQAGSEVDNVDQFSDGYDSQFEDGEFRDSSIQTWEGDEAEYRDIEEGTDNRGAFGTHENGSQCAPESSRIRSTDVGSQKGADEISSVLLPEKLDSSDQISGSEPNITETGITEVSMKDASQSDQWKMNLSGSDILPENHSSCNITKTKDFSSIKSSSEITEDLETKAEGSRFYGKEPSTLETVLCRSRFRMQGSSSTNADDSASRSLKDPGVLRSIGRGKYIRGGGTWNRSPPFSGPSFRRSLPEDASSADNLTNKVGVDLNITRQSFRSRLTVNREEDEFRARLGLRPSGDTCHNRFVNVGRGRSLRYGSRNNGGGPRGRYYGPANDEYDEPSLEYSHSFPNRQRRENHPYARHHSGSMSPTSRTRSPINEGFRRRSRSPNLRSDTRIRRPRSPIYRGHGFETNHVGGYNLEPRDNNNSPPSSRWLKHKQRSFVFDRRSPPVPIGDRLGFYDSSRKSKQNENFSSRFSELHGGGRGGGGRYLGSDGDVTDHGYRRCGGFVRPYDMSRPVKHIPYDEVDGYGPPVYDSHDKESLEFHGRGNHKPYVNGTDGRFRDIPRRAREDRENW